MTRDQIRAIAAYERARQVHGRDNRNDFEILVNDLAANILRSGLAAAIAFAERDKSRQAVQHLFTHLVEANIPGLTGTWEELPNTIRCLDCDAYMLATREIRKILTWLKRAVQAEYQE